jgi:opacity protein-like surface antigen
MHKKLFLLVVLTKCVLIASAQEVKQEQPAKKGCSCSFSSINQIGVLHGSKGGYFQLQSVNGIRYKTWFAGLGIGIDYYDRPTYPLFVDVRKYIFNKPSTPFLYADGGMHLVGKRVQKAGNWHQNEYYNGVYGDAGIGYAFGLDSKARWLISTGYSYKFSKRKYEYIPDCTGGPCTDSYYTFKSYFHRLTVKMGLQF